MPYSRSSCAIFGIIISLLITISLASAAPISQESTTEGCLQIEQADAFFAQGMSLIQSGQVTIARERLIAAREIYIACKDLESEADVLTAIGITYYYEGLYDEALAFNREALDLARQAASLQIQIDAFVNLAYIYLAQEKYEDALQQAQECIELPLVSENSIDNSGCFFVKGYLLNEWGVKQKQHGNYALAQGSFDASLVIFQNMNLPSEQAGVLHNLGANFGIQGQHYQAINKYQEALEFVQRTDSLDFQGRILHSMGGSYQDLGNYSQALIFYFQALEIQKGIDDPDGQGRTQLSIGETYTIIGECEKAEDQLQAALDNFRAINNPIQIGKTLNSIAINYGCLGKFQNELDYYFRARDVFAELDNKTAFEAAVLVNIGEFFRLEGRYDDALSFLEQGLEIAQELNIKITEASALHNISMLHYNQNSYQQALHYSEEALLLQQAIGNRNGEANSLFNIGYIHELQGDISQAIWYYKQAIEIIESVRTDIRVEGLKTSFIKNRMESYVHLIGLLWDTGQYEDAFNYTERSRARSFLDLVSTGFVDFRSNLDQQLIEREKSLQTEIAAKRSQLIQDRSLPAEQQDATKIGSTESDILALEKEYEQLIIEIKLRSPQAGSILDAEVATLIGIQERLNADVALIEYFVTEQKTLVFVVTNNSLTPVTLNTKQEDLYVQVKAFHDFPEFESAYPDPAIALYNTLITPIQHHLRDTPHLIIVPHQGLHYVPFAALTDGERYLMDEHTITYLPNASMLQFLPAPGAAPAYETALILANPAAGATDEFGNLFNAAQSAQRVASLFGTTPLLGEAATELAIRQNLSSANILHLGAHGRFNIVSPLQSTIYLTPGDDHTDLNNDGRLQVDEVYDLPLNNIELVILSACQTNLGYLDRDNPLTSISPGDELVSLNRAFLFQTPTVISTLWAVDDAATGLLIDQFYTYLLDDHGPADALRQAQMDVREQYPHPYYWAGFILSGDGGIIDPVLTQQRAVIPTPTQPPLLPEAEQPSNDHNYLAYLAAAILFLLIALIIGWRTRKGNN